MRWERGTGRLPGASDVMTAPIYSHVLSRDPGRRAQLSLRSLNQGGKIIKPIRMKHGDKPKR